MCLASHEPPGTKPTPVINRPQGTAYGARLLESEMSLQIALSNLMLFVPRTACAIHTECLRRKVQELLPELGCVVFLVVAWLTSMLVSEGTAGVDYAIPAIPIVRFHGCNQCVGRKFAWNMDWFMDCFAVLSHTIHRLGPNGRGAWSKLGQVSRAREHLFYNIILGITSGLRLPESKVYLRFR